MSDGVTLEHGEHSPTELLSSLGSYIYAETQSYLEKIQKDLTAWSKQRTDQTDMIEEGRIDIELEEGRESMIDAMGSGTDEQSINMAGSNSCEALATGPNFSTGPLELEASMLLKLLPPLKLSPVSITNDDLQSLKTKDRRSTIPYYPYLTAVPADDSNTTAIPLISTDHAPSLNGTLQDTQHTTPMQACHVTILEPLSQKRVIAFHSAGYGVGWMDFEACADWVCVPKQRRAE